MRDNAHQVLATCHKAQRLPSVASSEPCVVCRDPLMPLLGRWTPPSGYACLCVSLRRIFECTTAEYQLIDWAPSRPPPGSVRGSSTPRGPTSPSGLAVPSMEHAGLEPGDPRLTAVAIPGYQAAGPPSRYTGTGRARGSRLQARHCASAPGAPCPWRTHGVRSMAPACASARREGKRRDHGHGTLCGSPPLAPQGAVTGCQCQCQWRDASVPVSPCRCPTQARASSIRVLNVNSDARTRESPNWQRLRRLPLLQASLPMPMRQDETRRQANHPLP